MARGTLESRWADVSASQRVHAVWLAVTVSVALLAASTVVRAGAERDRAVRERELASESAAHANRQLASAARHIRQLRAKCGMEYP